MKDLVHNRRRLSLRKKLNLVSLALKENGLRWTLLVGVYGVASALANRAYGGMQHLRETKRIPGMNSLKMNQAIWEGWNWDGGGEEWTPSEPWKEGLISCVLRPQIPEYSRIIEIGPGGGRWTGELIERASSYLGLDISASCVEVCRRKFADGEKASFEVTDGQSLPGVADGSVDRVWSFDVFVHINTQDVRTYLHEIRRVLCAGGRAVLHHGTIGGALGGWRSDLTTAKMNELALEAGLTVMDQLKGWDHEGVFHPAGLYDDLITILEKPEHV